MLSDIFLSCSEVYLTFFSVLFVSMLPECSSKETLIKRHPIKKRILKWKIIIVQCNVKIINNSLRKPCGRDMRIIY